MQIIRDSHTRLSLPYAVSTIGAFDGVHRGHLSVLEQLKETAAREKGQSVVLTFWPHPRFVLGKDPDKLKLLLTLDEKVELLERTGIDLLYIHQFSPGLASLPAEAFVQNVLVEKLGAKHLIVGYDHHFGAGRKGGFGLMRTLSGEFGFKLSRTQEFQMPEGRISSTEIRKHLEGGQAHLASRLLGYHYFISGKVSHGRKVGRELGFPTANIEVEEAYKLLPGDGVYAVFAETGGQRFKAMLNIGPKPSFGDQQRSIEAHIFDFDENLYDKQCRIFFVKKLRDTQKFANVDALKAQLAKDRQASMDVLVAPEKFLK